MSIKVSLIAVQYGDVSLLMKLLASLEHHPDRKLIEEVIVVNNGLTLDKNARKQLAGFAGFSISIVDNPNRSYASGVNRGVAASRGDILIISNNDIEWLPESSIRPLIDWVSRDKIGIVGPQLVYPDGSWQRSYGRFPSMSEALISLLMLDSIWNSINMYKFRRNRWSARPKLVNYIDGAFMVVRRACFDELGGFDVKYTFYGEDTDFCWRAWQNGWKVVFVPNARVIHVRGASSTVDALEDYSVRLFQAKKRFVRDRYGHFRCAWYGRCIRVALWERWILYGLVAQITKKSSWWLRAYQAGIRYKAVREVKLL